MNTIQFAAKHGVTRDAVCKWIEAGLVPAKRNGHRWVIPDDAQRPKKVLPTNMITVRTNSELHNALRRAASKSGKSLNSFCVEALRESLT